MARRKTAEKSIKVENMRHKDERKKIATEELRIVEGE